MGVQIITNCVILGVRQSKWRFYRNCRNEKSKK